MQDLKRLIVKYSNQLKQQKGEPDFFYLMRLIELMRKDLPAVGYAKTPSEEAFRFGQMPYLNFPSTSIATISESHRHSEDVTILVYFFGLLGVNGPMPLEITDLVYSRNIHDYDSTLRRFLDLINHRLLTNTITIIYDLLAQTGSKRLTNAAGNYLMCAEYQVFRCIYEAGGENPETMFSLDQKRYKNLTTAAMLLDLEIADAVSEREKIALLQEIGFSACASVGDLWALPQAMFITHHNERYSYHDSARLALDNGLRFIQGLCANKAPCEYIGKDHAHGQ